MLELLGVLTIKEALVLLGINVGTIAIPVALTVKLEKVFTSEKFKSLSHRDKVKHISLALKGIIF